MPFRHDFYCVSVIIKFIMSKRGPYKRYLKEDLDGIPDSTYRSRRKRLLLESHESPSSSSSEFEVSYYIV